MENNSEQKSLFESLKEIRLEKGISLELIGEKYRVQLKYLESLEEGDLLAIPEVYDKLFFRSYIKALGLDEEKYYDEFIRIRRRIRVDKTTTVFEFSKKSEVEKKLINMRNALVLLPVILVVIVVWLMVSNTEMIHSNSTEPVNEIDIREVVRKMEVQPVTEQDTVETGLVSVPGDTLNLTIRGLKRTWFRVVRDKSDTLEYLFKGGENVNLTALNGYEFLIGRANGLAFSLNGRDLGSVSKDSVVVRYMKIDSTGIAVKLLKEAQEVNE